MSRPVRGGELTNQLAAAEKDEVARGVRALLGRPVLHERHDPELFALVRTRREPIARWFEYYCGWALTVEPRAGYARLAKVRAEHDGRRPARRERGSRAPFDRRRYTLFCVVAAELHATPVTTIGLLASRVELATANDPVVPSFDTARRAERVAYVDVLRHLEHLHVLAATDGSTESFVESAEAKVLYRVDTTLLVRLLAAPQGPSRVALPAGHATEHAAEHIAERFDGLLDELVVEPRYGDPTTRATSEVQRNLWLRHRVFRRLVDDPVVHRDDLGHDELAYISSPTGRRLAREAAEQAGMVLEERAEGWMLLDSDGLSSDVRFPDDSHAGAASLVLLDVLLAAPDGLTAEQLELEADAVLRREPNWAQRYRGSDDGASRLAADALGVLEAFGLVHRDAAGLVTVRPAAARYAVTRPASPSAPTTPHREQL